MYLHYKIAMPATFRLVRVLGREFLKNYVEQLGERVADGDELAEEVLEYFQEILRLSEEEGEADYVEELEEAYDPEIHGRLFSPTIVKLLSTIASGEVESVSQLARKLGRDVGNVYRDLKWLESLGLVYLENNGRKKAPRLLVLEYGVRFA